MRKRGFVWVGVGLLVYVISLLIDRPIVVRGTQFPLGWAIAAMGLVIAGWDAWKHRSASNSDGGKDTD
jgi:hypothetical protein